MPSHFQHHPISKLPGLQGCHITMEVDPVQQLLIFSLSHVFGFHRSLCFTSMQDGWHRNHQDDMCFSQNEQIPSLGSNLPSQGCWGSDQILRFGSGDSRSPKDVVIMVVTGILGGRSNISHHTGMLEKSSTQCLASEGTMLGKSFWSNQWGKSLRFHRRFDFFWHER